MSPQPLLPVRASADFSQCPFWFWNDDLQEAEILRQIADFQAHGVDAFVIHPRVGLPRHLGWLSDGLFRFMRLALDEARRRGMWVVLYDEGMYPSGSASGLVVANNPAHQVRGLCCLPGPLSPQEQLRTDARLIAESRRSDGTPLWIYDRHIDTVIRGLHYLGDESLPEPREEEPPAADLLNPEASASFIRLVYDRFHAELGGYFGNTVRAIFTDEPSPLARFREKGIVPGSGAFLDWARTSQGVDFRADLPALWFDDEPGATRVRRTYSRAIGIRLDETYYKPLAAWCERHGVALTGHPAAPDDIGHLRHFHIPGQDIVWRDIEPFKPSALEGPSSTMAKAAASSAFHQGRARNMNEFAGAFGHSLTFFELRWLASWLLIRGCNLLMPHAFYYSMRGPRRDERPPDVGPNSPWWPDYRPWAEFSRRICFLNATYPPVVETAILGRRNELPWRAARSLFENQIDFHYIDEDDLASARFRDGIWQVGPGRYSALLVEDDFDAPPRALRWNPDADDAILAVLPRCVRLNRPAPELRVRLLDAGGESRILLLFNEGPAELRRTMNFLPDIRLSRIHLESASVDSGCGPTWNLSPGEWAAFLIQSLSGFRRHPVPQTPPGVSEAANPA